MKNFKDFANISNEEISPCSEYDEELKICKTTKESCDGCYSYYTSLTKQDNN